MAKRATIVSGEIPGIDTPWEWEENGELKAYDGASVEALLRGSIGGVQRGKLGYLHRTAEAGDDNCHHILGFASEADFLEWQSDPEGRASLLLADVPLPAGGGNAAASFMVGLASDTPAVIVTTERSVKLRLRFTSEEYNPLTQTTTPTGEGGTLTVQTRRDGQGAWVTRGTVENIPSVPSSQTGEWTEVDITAMLDSGAQQARVIVKGESTGLNTRYIAYSVTMTTLALSFATRWEEPVTGSVMRLLYYVSGAVSKTLHVRIDGGRELTRDLGTAVYTEAPLEIAVSDGEGEPFPVMTHGVHEVEAWLTATGSAARSSTARSELMVVADPADTSPRVILGEVASGLTNWTSQRMLSYAVHNPAGTATPLRFILGDSSGEETYMEIDAGGVPSGERRALDNMVEIESDAAELAAYMRFVSGDAELRPKIGFSVDNSGNFAPTAGADFILNPRHRTNDEAEPLRVVNAATGQEVPSEWAGFGLSDDGWTDDGAGQRCLRVPAGRSLTIGYEALADYIGTDNRRSMTIELDIATRNATDTASPVLRVCSYMADGEPLGLELRPWQAVFMTANNRVRVDQDVMISEGARTHIAVNIMHGIGGTPHNYIRIFVNGVINREMEWDEADTLVQSVGGARTSQGIRVGGPGCDIDVYGIRVYRKALSSADILRDYMATLPGAEEKLAVRAANDILDDSGRVSYARAKGRYNTLLITGVLPSKATGNVKTLTDWDIDIPGDPAHSGRLNAMETTGQGTSSRSYWKWNQQGKPTAATEWVDGLGECRGAGYQLDDSVPMATKIVAKLNWASSQQSHKMGSCNLYTDLWRACTGGSSITASEGRGKCRVTVRQKPFLLFTRADGEGEPAFYGLCTMGPGKGDKATFGCDLEAFPQYLMLEGCDNGEPLTNHRMPWTDDITLEGDTLMHNGAKQWEVVMGNTGSLPLLREAFNFVYLCTPHIRPFIGTAGQLRAATAAQADRQKLQWVTQAGDGAAKYDLYRYEGAAGGWVPAGAGKTAEGGYTALNLAEQLGLSPEGALWEDINARFIAARVAKFRSGAGNYFKLSDALFHSMFCKLVGASDNRAKNTYLYLAEHDGAQKIHFAQDDLDTIFMTDNVGRKSKPYHVEEHDRDAEGGTYWNGESNALHDLLELAFPGEMRSMMRTILGEMANLAADHTPMGCMEDYYFSTQRYFPAVAYNETARLLYEEAAAKMSEGEYSASVNPIKQSLGDQLQGELQWVRLRLAYMSSYASYGPFAQNGAGAMEFRSKTTSAGTAPAYTFKLTPHIWLYPAVAAGSSVLWGSGKSAPQRVAAGEEYTLGGVAADNDTNIQLLGADYYSKVGDWGDKSMQGTFTVCGARLTEFRATGAGMEFRPSSVQVTAPNLRVLDLRGASTVGGEMNLTGQTRLAEIDLRGTSVNAVRVGNPGMVTALRLPATLTELRLRGYSSLTAEGFSVEGMGNIQRLEISGTPGVDSKALVMAALAGGNLAECKVQGAEWTNVSLARLLALADIRADIRGKVTLIMNEANTPGIADKARMAAAWGDIDSDGNALRVEYRKVPISSIAVSGPGYIWTPGEHRYEVAAVPASGNNVAIKAGGALDIAWSIDGGQSHAAMGADGVLTATSLDDTGAEARYAVTCELTTTSGAKLTAQTLTGFYRRAPKIGDFAYADGSFDDLLRPDKTVVGLVYKIDELWQGPDDAEPKCFTGYTRPSAEDTAGRALVGYRALVDCKEDILYHSEDGSVNGHAAPWGLQGSNDAYGHAAAADELAAAIGTNPFDLAGIPNTGYTAGTNLTGNVVTADSYLDGDTADGFKHFTGASAQNDWAGRRHTAVIAAHAAKLMSMYLLNGAYGGAGVAYEDSLGQTHTITGMPANVAELSESLDILTKANGGQTKYRGFLYPAALGCRLYLPPVQSGEELDPQYGRGAWHLPSAAELFRMGYFFGISRAGGLGASAQTPGRGVADAMIQAARDAGDDNEISGSVSQAHIDSDEYTAAEVEAINRYFHNLREADKPIYAMAEWRAQAVAKRLCPITQRALTQYWSSTESAGDGAMYCSFSTLLCLLNFNAYMGTKAQAYRVRPTAAYDFML